MAGKWNHILLHLDLFICRNGITVEIFQRILELLFLNQDIQTIYWQLIGCIFSIKILAIVYRKTRNSPDC